MNHLCEWCLTKLHTHHDQSKCLENYLDKRKSMAVEKKANHQANIVRIKEILPHNNADSLEIVPVGEYQIVARKGQFKVGDLGVYIQPDSVVPQTEPFRFIWQPYSYAPETGAMILVPEKRRRITVRKFRGEWSEGLLLPLDDFIELSDSMAYEADGSLLGKVTAMPRYEGDDVSDLLGITHYDPDAGKESTGGENEGVPKLRKKYPKTLKGWYKWIIRKLYGIFSKDPLSGKSENIILDIPVYDVDALKNYPHTFIDGEKVRVSEKIHGSNAKYICLDGKMYAGSRTLWKSENSGCIWRQNLKVNPWIEEWCRAHEGYVIWGEVTPTQGKYDYGSKDIQFFVFDVRHPSGYWLDATNDDGILTHLQAHSVPELYNGPYDLEAIKKLVDGPSTVRGAKHIREGVVIKTAKERHQRGVGRCQLKIVSNAYLEKDNK